MDYGLKDNAAIRARDIKYNLDRTEFLLDYPEGKIPMNVPLIGRHNVYNILALLRGGIKKGFL